MAFDIIIKPLVLFDLEDKIRLRERQTEGEGKRLYHTFLTGLSDLQSDVQLEDNPVYDKVKKYVAKEDCSLFYTIVDNTILVVGML